MGWEVEGVVVFEDLSFLSVHIFLLSTFQSQVISLTHTSVQKAHACTIYTTSHKHASKNKSSFYMGFPGTHILSLEVTHFMTL